MCKDYNFLSKLFLRAPYYSFNGYDLNRLPEVLRQQDFLNAIWLASPGFYDTLQKQGFVFEKLSAKQKHTLHKYYNRMCFRPTPFGSFASFTLLDWEIGKTVKLSANSGSRLHLVPDLQLIAAVNAKTLSDDAFGDIAVNPCLYRCNETFRYFKSEAKPDGQYSFSLAAVEANDFHVALLARINSGFKSSALLHWMMERGECSIPEAVDYLQFLIDEQVILSGNTVKVIQDDLFRLAGTGLAGWTDYWNKLQAPVISANLHLADAAIELESLISGITGDRRYFYSALERPLEAGGPAVADQQKLSGALKLLQLFSPATDPQDLAAFKREFSRRFDQQRIPLLTALDADTGISYSNLLTPEGRHEHLDDLHFPEGQHRNPKPDWTPAHQVLFRLWIGDRQRDQWSPIVFGAEDIKELEDKQTDNLKHPQTQLIMYRNTGEHLLIEHAGGVAAPSLIGRFSVFSKPVHDLCRELAAMEIESNPGVLFADIGQLTNLHVDNINRRKAIYDYEIPVNVISELASEVQLPPGDLLLSMQAGELILESARSGARVIPRLSTAYNFRHNTLPVFRLLCDMQYQGLNAGTVLDLEQFFPGLSFYPRVCTADVVLCLARWRLSADEFSEFKEGDMTAKIEAVKAFRRKHHLPRYISLGENDQQLVFDLAVKEEVAFFLQCIEGMKTVTVQEYFYPDRSVMTGNKPLAGQFIAFLGHRNRVYEGIVRKEPRFLHDIQRSFMAGSDWLYLKIFCSPRVSDSILALVIRPFVADHQSIRKWFFIRYTEQGNHLRLRFHGEEDDMALILPELNKRLADGGYELFIRDYQADTYHREIERYSAELIPEMEELFRKGSDLVTGYLYGLASGELEPDSFLFGLLTAKLMISAYLKDDNESLRFVKRVRDGFLNEFNADKPFSTALDQRYRKLKGALDKLFDAAGLPGDMKALLNQVSKIAVLSARSGASERYSLLADAVHMQLNRTFNVQQRQQELLVYYFLEKYLASVIARSRVNA